MAFQMPSFLSRLLRPFSTSMSRPLVPDALAAKSFDVPTERAIFAGGCFWGLEELYRHHWGKGKGLLDCRVGYTGGDTQNPSYRSVCGGDGHAESLLVVYDPQVVTFGQLVEFFFRMHDPTTLDRQGPDTGVQYRSAVFATSEEQLRVAREMKDKVAKVWYPGKTVTTQVLMAGPWYDAEDNHQDYLARTPYGYQCPAHYLRTQFPPLQ